MSRGLLPKVLHSMLPLAADDKHFTVIPEPFYPNSKYKIDDAAEYVECSSWSNEANSTMPLPSVPVMNTPDTGHLCSED